MREQPVAKFLETMSVHDIKMGVGGRLQGNSGFSNWLYAKKK